MLQNEIHLKIFSNNKIFLKKNLKKLEYFLNNNTKSLYYKKKILNKKTKLTFLRSPHVNKSSREQFFQNQYILNLKIYNITNLDLNFINNFLKKNISINYNIKITSK